MAQRKDNRYESYMIVRELKRGVKTHLLLNCSPGYLAGYVNGALYGQWDKIEVINGIPSDMSCAGLEDYEFQPLSQDTIDQLFLGVYVLHYIHRSED